MEISEIIGITIALISALLAALSIPEVRRRFGLDKPSLDLRSYRDLLFSVAEGELDELLRQYLIDGKTFIDLEVSVDRRALKAAPPAYASPIEIDRENTAKISQLAQSFPQKLLILGNAGTGKTTLLLLLQQSLLMKTKREADQVTGAMPVPVLFHISSWNAGFGSISKWMVDQLFEHYTIPRHAAELLVESNSIFPLFDGLDEVAPAHFTACINAINTYVSRYSIIYIIITCRLLEYQKLSAKLNFKPAELHILPPSQQDIKTYVGALGPGYRSASTIIENTSQDSIIGTTPLILNLAIQLAKNTDYSPAQLLSVNTLAGMYKAYVDWIISRPSQKGSDGRKNNVDHSYALVQLSLLAKKMKGRNDNAFFPEELQPDWLHEPGLIAKYKASVAFRITLLIVLGVTAYWSVLTIAFLPSIVLDSLGVIFLFGFEPDPPILFIIAAAAIVFMAIFFGFVTVPLAFVISLFFSIRNSRSYIAFPENTKLSWSRLSTMIHTISPLNYLWPWFWIESGLIYTGLGERSRDEDKVAASRTLGLGVTAMSMLAMTVFLFLSLLLLSPLHIPTATYTTLATFNVIFGVLQLFFPVLCVILGLRWGGAAYIKHSLLKNALVRHQIIPHDLEEVLLFGLNYNVLHKTGRGYMFSHETLFDYFADEGNWHHIRP